MVPDRQYTGGHVPCTDARVEGEEEEEAIVVEADAIIDEWAVVAHHEDALVADAAMVCSGWLDCGAIFALFFPGGL